MADLQLGLRKVEVPYTLRLYGVTEEMFDEFMTPDIKADLIDGVMIVRLRPGRGGWRSSMPRLWCSRRAEAASSPELRHD
jgi:hypothetical protein